MTAKFCAYRISKVISRERHNMLSLFDGQMPLSFPSVMRLPDALLVTILSILLRFVWLIFGKE